MTRSQGIRLALLLVGGGILIGIAKFSSLTHAGFVNQRQLLQRLLPAVDHAPETKEAAFLRRVAGHATSQVGVTTKYDPSYVALAYPGGDVPSDRGVCTDVVIRAYRQEGIDLQRDVHEDMESAFWRYPKSWRLLKPDANIDHRRVPNLMVFFARHGLVLPVSQEPAAYRPGDVVTWDLGGGVTHIGLVSTETTTDQRPKIVHNVGEGTRVEDVLFKWRILGHYRYLGQGRRSD